MKIEIDWTEQSTKRGAIWFAGSAIAILFLTFSSIDKAMAVMTITGLAAGGLGLAVKD